MTDNVLMTHPDGGECKAHISQVENMKAKGWVVSDEAVKSTETEDNDNGES
ncbi:hypothetical protein [uncultured Paraglaciecola sp.]|uniref:hypothetical protein n=1 Tax=uncultured Paraglaciecola sp. TaxID=1765024 RepID=UPI0026242E8D|nr:hypothetical protein [uncultured Paraglaciecola sp.]